LFATHYFELTALATEIDGCANVHLDATEHGEGIVFLHAVKDGPASRSYGLQVAQLAGVPRDVIGQARQYLEALEAQRDRPDTNGSGRRKGPQKELPLFAATPSATVPALREPVAGPAAAPEPAAPDELRVALEALDPDELSPKAALEALYKLRKLVERRK
jgi:DNA mismatch repair protein MutS